MSTVAIVDDHRPFSSRLGTFVEALPGWSVVGAVEDAIAGLELVSATRPDVALVDVGLPGQNGFWFTERAIAIVPALRVILMSDAEPEEYAEAAQLVGAVAYVAKHTISRDLPALLREATGSGPGTDGRRPVPAPPPSGGGAGGNPSAGPGAVAAATLFERSALSLTEPIVAGAACLVLAAAGEPALGVVTAVALLALHRQWSPSRARRGRARGRGLQRSDLDR